MWNTVINSYSKGKSTVCNMASKAVIKSSASLWSLTSCVLGVPGKKNKSFSDNESNYGSGSESETSTDDIVFDTIKPKKSTKAMKKDSQPEIKYAERVEYSTISMDDFLYKQNEFRLWLREKSAHELPKNVVLTTNLDEFKEYYNAHYSTSNHKRKPELCSRLSASKQNKYFKEFVKLWNKRKLPPKYYKPTLLTRRDTLAPVNHNQRFSFVETADSPLIPNFQPSPQVSFTSDSPQRIIPLSTFGKKAGQAAAETLQAMSNPVRRTPSFFGDDTKLLFVPAPVTVKQEPEPSRVREPKKRKTNRNDMIRKCSVCTHHPLTRQCAKKCLLAPHEDN